MAKNETNATPVSTSNDRQALIHIHSNVSDRVPTKEQLHFGELAVNYSSGNEFISFKNQNQDIVKVLPESKVVRAEESSVSKSGETLTVKINGASGSLTNTDTHKTSRNVVPVNQKANGNVYIQHTEDGIETSRHTITGTGSCKVTSDESGNIKIHAEKNTDTKVTSVENHYTPQGGNTMPASSTATGAKTFITGITEDGKGHVTSITKGTIPAAPTALPNPNALTIKAGDSTAEVYSGSFPGEVNFVGNGATRVEASDGVITISSTDTNTDTKVTSVENHYKPLSGTAIKGGSAGKAIGSISMDAAGHVTDVTETNKVSLAGTADTSKAVVMSNGTDETARNLWFSVSSQKDAVSGSVQAASSTNLKFNPATNDLTIAGNSVLTSIEAVGGVNINSVGIPEVSASNNNGKTTLTFNKLKGERGEKGLKGDKGDPFTVYKTYTSIENMNSDAKNVPDGSFVMISNDNMEDVDNSKLFVKGGSSFKYITDLSGAQGIKGDTGSEGNGISSITSTSNTGSGQGNTVTVNYTKKNSDRFTVYNGARGETGPRGNTGYTPEARSYNYENYWWDPLENNWIFNEGVKVKCTGNNGADGRGIESTNITYQAGSNYSVAPSGIWSSSPVSVSQGQYLWAKIDIQYTDGTSDTMYSVARQGIDGRNGTNGSDGRGISGVETEYGKSSSSSEKPSSWSSSVSSLGVLTEDDYVWTKRTTTYTKGSPSTTTDYSVAKCGKNGVSISDITSTDYTGSHSTNTVTVHLSDGTSKYFYVYNGYNGADGSSVKMIDSHLNAMNLGDTFIAGPDDTGAGFEKYHMYTYKGPGYGSNSTGGYTDSGSVRGPQGPQGPGGGKGEKGNSITSVTSSKSGKTTTVTITGEGSIGSNSFKIEDGKDGGPGPKGDDGLTTKVKVNGTTYTQSNGLITLPDYPSTPEEVKAAPKNHNHDGVYLKSQYISKNIVGTSSISTDNAAVSENTNKVYLNHLENSTVESSHFIKGDGITKVSSDVYGNITISSADTNTDYQCTSSGHYTPSGGLTTQTGSQLKGDGDTVVSSLTVDPKGHITKVGLGKLDIPTTPGDIGAAPASHTHDQYVTSSSVTALTNFMNYYTGQNLLNGGNNLSASGTYSVPTNKRTVVCNVNELEGSSYDYHLNIGQMTDGYELNIVICTISSGTAALYFYLPNGSQWIHMNNTESKRGDNIYKFEARQDNPVYEINILKTSKGYIVRAI